MIAAVGCIVSKQSLFICKKRAAVSAGNFGADVFAVVAGVMPLNAVSGLNFIIAAAVIRINSVHTVHPAAALTAVKFVKVVDSFNVCAVENRGIAGFHMDLPVSCFAAENIENSLAVVKGHGCFFSIIPSDGSTESFSGSSISMFCSIVPHSMSIVQVCPLSAEGISEHPGNTTVQTNASIASSKAEIRRLPHEFFRLIKDKDLLIDITVFVSKLIIAACFAF